MKDDYELSPQEEKVLQEILVKIRADATRRCDVEEARYKRDFPFPDYAEYKFGDLVSLSYDHDDSEWGTSPEKIPAIGKVIYCSKNFYNTNYYYKVRYTEITGDKIEQIDAFRPSDLSPLFIT